MTTISTSSTATKNVEFFFSSICQAILKEIDIRIGNIQKFLVHAFKLYHEKTFYAHCKAHKIKLPPSESLEIHPGDAVLVSAPTERCKQSYRNNASVKLQNNLKLAESIFQYVTSKMPHSDNYLSRTFTATNAPVVVKRFLLNKSSGFELARKIKKQGYAICEELAFLGAIHAIKKYPDQRVECASIAGGRHTFLIIGREQDSDLLDYKTWGKDSVICDIWAGKYYPTSSVEEELYDYIECYGSEIKGNYITYPHVRRFDPQRQILRCRVLNLSRQPGMFQPEAPIYMESVPSPI